MKTENELHLEHLKKEFNEEALLFKARAEVVAEDVAEKLESKVVSIAEAIRGDKNPETTDYVEVLKNEADKAFRLQTKLLSFVEKVSDEPDSDCTERMKLLEGTLRVHLSELQGEYREIGNAISKHETDWSDKIASVSGAFNAARVQALDEWKQSRSSSLKNAYWELVGDVTE